MSADTFDAIVIGAGSGGLTVAVGLTGFGRRVALVEKGRVGGDCTNTGCIPSKRLIHLARHRDGESAAALLADVRATRDGLAEREHHELSHTENLTLIAGAARFRDARTVEVDDGRRVLTARSIIVATGSMARSIEIPGLPAELVLTNDTLFEVAAPPEHLVIVGAGAIGVEMAAAFVRLGSRVTVIDQADRVLPEAIPEASSAVAAALDEMGATMCLRSTVASFDPADRTLTLSSSNGSVSVGDVDRVLMAVGRVPRIDELNLPAAGVAATPSGITVDGWGRTSQRGVWAVGDVTPGSHQTHAANALGRRIVQRIALRALPPIGRPPLIPSAVFGEPEVAWVGLSTAERVRRWHPHATIRLSVDLADIDRGLTDGVRRGLVVIDAVRLTGRIVSATVVGPNASELIAILTLAMARSTSLLRLSRLVYAYPTFAGAIGRLADDFARHTLGGLRREVGGYLRYRFTRPSGTTPA